MQAAQKSQASAPKLDFADPFLMIINPEAHKAHALAAHASGNGKGRLYKPVESSAMSRPRKLFDVFEPSGTTGEWQMIRDPGAPPPPPVTVGIIPPSIPAAVAAAKE